MLVVARLSSYTPDKDPDDQNYMERSTSSSVSDEDCRSPRHCQPSENKTTQPALERRKRHRRGRKRKKPYSTSGGTPNRPVAPSNTTQFIMEDRGETSVRIPSQATLSRSISCESSPSGDDCWYDTSDEQDTFLEEDFNQVVAQMRMERLDSMSKEDLVSQCLGLEQKVSTLMEQKDITELDLHRKLSDLQNKNEELLLENTRLKTMVPSSIS